MTTCGKSTVRGRAPAAQHHTHTQRRHTLQYCSPGAIGSDQGPSSPGHGLRKVFKPITPSLLMETIRDLFDNLISIGGLAAGSVVSLISAVLLILSDIIPLDNTTLALAWIMMAFVFAAGFLAVRRHIREYQEQMERAPLTA